MPSEYCVPPERLANPVVAIDTDLFMWKSVEKWKAKMGIDLVPGFFERHRYRDYSITWLFSGEE